MGFLNSQMRRQHRGDVMGSDVNNTPFSVDNKLIEVQNRIREDFGFGLEDDLNSAYLLSKKVMGKISTDDSINDIRARLSTYEEVVVMGAAVEPEDLSCLDSDFCLIAADGSVGVLNELENTHSQDMWQRLALVVSDADGGAAIIDAAKRNIPFALHAHGDNIDAWNELLPTLLAEGITILPTHQCPTLVNNMVNPGGFTDGDRAVCLVKAMGIENITLVGFTTSEIGRWTGRTDPVRKMRKLKWMAEVLGTLGFEV